MYTLHLFKKQTIGSPVYESSEYGRPQITARKQISKLLQCFLAGIMAKTIKDSLTSALALPRKVPLRKPRFFRGALMLH